MRRPSVSLARVRPSAGLVLLVVVATLEAVAWSLVTPAFQGPDEASHLAAIERVQQGGLVPRGQPTDLLPRDVLLLGTEANLSPLVGNVAVRPAWTLHDERRWRVADRRLGNRGDELVPLPGRDPAPPITGANRNPPLYYLYAAPADLVASGGTIVDRIQLMRLANVLPLVATVILTWLLAAELLPGLRWARALAAGIVALHPQLAFLSGTVNPDPLLVALTTLALLFAVRLVRRGLSVRGVASLGAAVMAVAATHPRGLAIAPAALLALVLAARPVLAGRARPLAGVLAGVLVAWVGLVVAALPVVARGARTDDVGLNGSFVPREFASYLWQFYLPKLGFMEQAIGPDYGFREVYVETLNATFGSLEVQFTDGVYDVVQAVMLLLGALIVAALVARVGANTPRVGQAAVLTCSAACTVLTLHALSYWQMTDIPSDPIIVGRHLLPMLPVAAVAIAFGVSALPRGAGLPVASLLFGGLVAIQLAGLGLTFARFYS